MPDLRTTCVIAGGGPAGVMLGLLLARQRMPVLVLEKHSDFLRDFRGDTVHPSTLHLMQQLGLLDEFLRCPHQEVEEIGANVGGQTYRVADFRRLPVPARFIALMPQWDFLEFVSRAAARFPGFELMRSTEVTGLIEEGGRVVGVEAQGVAGKLRIRADLVVGADGRYSRVRESAALARIESPAPIDVLWLRIPRAATDPAQTLGYFNYGRMIVLLQRDDYWQCAVLIRKGQFEEIRSQGLARFREDLVRVVPHLAQRVDSVTGWDQVKLLTVQVDRLRSWWKPGLLCIGDAAHAMSPVGGVGINLAIQDAVAAANRLAAPLRDGRVADAHLASVQQRRELPVRVVQAFQTQVHRRLIEPVLSSDRVFEAPWMLKLMDRVAALRGIPARFIGLGIRRERIAAIDGSR